MTSWKSFAKGWPTETKEGYKWEVVCLDCDTSLGTMASEDLMRAILATANRGGIKCPDCRQKSCEICGENWDLNGAEQYHVYQVKDWPTPMRICWMCKQDLLAQYPEEDGGWKIIQPPEEFPML